jgi:hypothetical protein
MKKYIILSAALILLMSGCIGFVFPDKIPHGVWNYKLLVNGVSAGSAVISNKKNNDNYESISEFNIEMGGISTISKETVVETLDFKPVSLESYSRIINGSDVHETLIRAVFNGTKVELSTNNRKAVYDIKREFLIEGNYCMAKLIEGGFKEGMEVESRIYHPSIELDDTVLVKTRFAGIEDVNVNGRPERLIHITQSIENIKSIDIYIGSDGITRKAVISMLNLKIELIKK